MYRFTRLCNAQAMQYWQHFYHRACSVEVEPTITPRGECYGYIGLQFYQPIVVACPHGVGMRAQESRIATDNREQITNAHANITPGSRISHTPPQGRVVPLFVGDGGVQGDKQYLL